MAAMISVDFQNCFIFILLCLISFLCYSLLLRKPKDSRVGPPSPPSLPIIGHLHLILSCKIHKSFQKLSSKYGPLLHLRIFNAPIVLVSSASVAYEVFRAHDLNVSYRNVSAGDESLVFGSSGMVNAPYGDYLKFIKKVIATKMLRPEVLERSRGVRAEELERLYKKLLHVATKKQSVEIFEEAVRLVNNSLCKMSMGRSLSEEKNEAERVLELSAELSALSLKIFFAQMLRNPLEKLGISLFKKEIMSVSRRFEEFLERVLSEHEEKLDEHHQGEDAMDALLAAYRDQNAEYNITRNQIKSLFAELFLGANDSSAAAIQWAMAEIIKNPKILEILRQEIDSVVEKTRLVHETDLPKLPYLQAVVKEVLRLHPYSPLLIRTFQQECKIEGFYIAQGTTLVINAYALMRDPYVWEDPDEFKPERFLPSSRSGQEDERRERALKFITFGSGRRACSGENLAHLFVGTAIGMMVQCFDWEIKGDKVNMEEASGKLFLTMAHPFEYTLLPRSLNPLPSNPESTTS